MKSISRLFEVTNQDIDGNHLDRMARRYRYFNSDCYDNIPKMKYPTEGTKSFQNDLKEVLRCHNQPSLATKFLRSSDNSVENVFKQFCKENGFDLIDWGKIRDIIKDVDSIVLKLKYENNRPRPLHYLKDMAADDLQIKYKKSPSYPSGHTTIAYFLCDILSANIPELQQDLQTLASLVGQTRIENAVHFPTDINYGRLVGENLATFFLSQGRKIISADLDPKNYQVFGEKICKKAKEVYSDNAYEAYAHELADFLHRTNEIEFYKTSYEDCLSAAQHAMMGYPSNYITTNKHIKSQLDGLVMSNKCGDIDNNHKVIRIHECFDPTVLERGSPGELRNFSHKSRAGTQFPEPCDIHRKLTSCHAIKDKAWIRHLLYEYIHPFCDGNGRSGRIILASDLDYNFEMINKMIGEDYIPTIVKQMEASKLEKLL